MYIIIIITCITIGILLFIQNVSGNNFAYAAKPPAAAAPKPKPLAAAAPKPPTRSSVAQAQYAASLGYVLGLAKDPVKVIGPAAPVAQAAPVAPAIPKPPAVPTSGPTQFAAFAAGLKGQSWSDFAAKNPGASVVQANYNAGTQYASANPAATSEWLKKNGF